VKLSEPGSLSSEAYSQSTIIDAFQNCFCQYKSMIVACDAGLSMLLLKSSALIRVAHNHVCGFETSILKIMAGSLLSLVQSNGVTSDPHRIIP
jgi:hypothetical protein